jgi:hypothetical protein
VCCGVLKPAKIDRRAIFEFEQATEAAFENGFINGGTVEAFMRILLVGGNDDLDRDATFGSVAVELKFKSVIVTRLGIGQIIGRIFERLYYNRRKPECGTFKVD